MTGFVVVVYKLSSYLSNVFNIDNNKKCFWAANQYIIMISERSCDTEDWNNDAENTALHHRNKL